jgi:hypothetical protein
MAGILLVLTLVGCTDDPATETPARVSSSELRDRVDALLADTPSAINCGYAIEEGVLEADVVEPLTDAEAVRQDLAERLRVPLEQVRVTASKGTCGDG